MIREPGRRCLVHCIAGQNRAPTVAWLYLIALGLEPPVATALIGGRTLDAVPGHPRLVDDDLVRSVRRWGQDRLRPISRRELLDPA